MRFPTLILALGASVLIATGCARDKEPAQNAVTTAETALAQIRPQAQQFAPEHLQTVEAELATMKENLAREKYRAVLDDAKTFNADVNALNDAVVSKQTQIAAATHEWEQLSEEVPQSLQAIEAQIGNMKGKKAESAKTELESMKAMWQEAAAAFTAGDAASATDKGRAVQAKAKEVREQLGMTPA